jgi:hypothetical protein
METAIMIAAILCLCIAIYEINRLKNKLKDTENKLEEVLKAYNKKNRLF